MQNKGAIRLFAILLALVCLYQLSFTVVVNLEKNKAKDYVKSHPGTTESNYLDSIAGKGVYNFLWLKDFTYRECQERELSLGLDLKGGMNVILEVSVPDIVRSMANNKQDSVFVAAMNRAIKAQETSQDDFVTLFGNAFTEVAPPGYSLASLFVNIDMPEITYNSTNDQVLDILRKETDGAIGNSFNILRSRIDRFGVTSPNIQELDRAGRILVELPGINEPERVRKLLQGSANLEFWETYDNPQVFESLRAINNKIKDLNALKKSENDTLALSKLTSDSTVTKQDTTGKSNLVADNTADTGSLKLLDKIEKQDTSKSKSLDNSVARFQEENPLFYILRPSVDNNNRLLEGATVGTSHQKDTAKVNRYLRMKQVQELLPKNLKLVWEVKPINDKEYADYFRLIALKITNRDGLPALSGDVITNAREQFGQNQATAEVSMSMNAEGASAWARLTKANVGKQIAIVLDNFVYSAPVVQNEITGGSSQITGNFTIKEAQDLANILKSGKLPAPARIIEEEIVGPSLGQESIDAGMSSFAIAFLLVILYMMFYYKSSGIAADIALIVNVFFIFGVLASLNAVLTLPGLAGIVLTMGMAVDANVLIYERVKDELKQGKGLRLAINEGFKHALSAIIDSNVTTLLTGIVLLLFGHGPIQGFATTLIIGILTTLFTAIFITRLIFLALLDRKINISFSTRWTENFLRNTKVDFVGMRKYFYAFSIIISLIGLASLVTKGLNPGIDFVGGRSYVVKFKEPVKATEIASILKPEFENAPEVKTYGGDNQVKISTKFMVNSTEKSADSIVEAKLYNGLKKVMGDNVTVDQFNKEYKQSGRKVGPTIADDIKMGAVYAVISALIIMFVYIFIRFKGWQFGLGAIVALFHDVLFVLGIFSIFNGILPFSLEIDQAFIAAILTVIGYSVNDSVVVFDRVREYLTEHSRWDSKTLYNAALNSTLSRTMNTSFTTLLTITVMFVFGGEVIRGFMFALLVGIGIGTYSSVFVATSMVYDTFKRSEIKVEDGNKIYKGSKKEKEISLES
ncbi:MAG: protein translocase subunit SecDF [Bacteroidales bacterium]